MDEMDNSEKKFITTAISYANGPPHIGHAFEFVIADAYARWFKSRKKYNVHFLTGMDEHGQKIQNTAEEKKLSCQELCDQVSALFVRLNADLNVSYDRFIRTTEEGHKLVVKQMFERCKEDIYLGEYVGWYNPREETFISEFDAKQNEFKDPVSGKPYVKMKEPSYFFRLGKYQDKIKQHILSNPGFIIGNSNDILARLEKPVHDLSISRTSISWGIPIPDNPEHVFYVWFDALLNYVTGSTSWPPSVQVIGKDITWFHAVIWLGMLMSAGMELPKHLFVHGFVNDKEGKKMSKSVGNVVSPTDLIAKYPCSAIRFFLLKENVANDVNFSEEGLIRAHDSELLAGLGNLVNRTFSMFFRYCNGIVPDVKPLERFDIANLISELNGYVEAFQFHTFIEKTFQILNDLNLYVNETEIWNIGKKDDTRTEQDRNVVLMTLLEGLFVMGHLLKPLIPSVSQTLIVDYFEKEFVPIEDLTWSNLKPGTVIEKKKTILFTILDKDAYEIRKKKNIAK